MCISLHFISTPHNSWGPGNKVVRHIVTSCKEQDWDESEIEEGKDNDSFVMVESRIMLTPSGQTVRRPLCLDL